MNARRIALIPARSGSKRIPEKNVRPLSGHPLIAYAIAAAHATEEFDRIVVSTDTPVIADIARSYRAEVPFLRDEELAADTAADFGWISECIDRLELEPSALLAILRPTNPFRQPDTIAAACRAFEADPTADSLRAVQPCREHPGKMWVRRGRHMTPLLPSEPRLQSRPYQNLPAVLVQNASLEWTRVETLQRTGHIEGDVVLPFAMPGREGFDLNVEDDWLFAEWLIQTGRARLPGLPQEAQHG